MAFKAGTELERSYNVPSEERMQIQEFKEIAERVQWRGSIVESRPFDTPHGATARNEYIFSSFLEVFRNSSASLRSNPMKPMPNRVAKIEWRRERNYHVFSYASLADDRIFSSKCCAAQIEVRRDLVVISSH